MEKSQNSTLDKNSDLTSLKSLMFILSTYMFGLRFLMSLMTLYYGFKSNSRFLWITNFFLFGWIFLGFWNSFSYIFMTSCYLLIINKDSILENLGHVKKFLDNLVEYSNKSENSNFTEEEQKLMEKYNEYVQKVVFMWNFFNTKYNLIFQTVQNYYTIIENYGAKANSYYENYNVSYYLSLVDRGIQIVVNWLKLVLNKIPYVNNFTNTYNKILSESYDGFNEINRKLESSDKKVETTNAELEEFTKKLESMNMNIPQQDFFKMDFDPSKIPPPTENDLKKINELMSMMGNMENMMNDLDKAIKKNK